MGEIVGSMSSMTMLLDTTLEAGSSSNGPSYSISVICSVGSPTLGTVCSLSISYWLSVDGLELGMGFFTTKRKSCRACTCYRMSVFVEHVLAVGRKAAFEKIWICLGSVGDIMQEKSGKGRFYVHPHSASLRCQFTVSTNIHIHLYELLYTPYSPSWQVNRVAHHSL